ncbi:hypothetical protein BZG36_00250 [Bifiguratus adelaidae]|uniref:Rad21/Rec8-like protein N-terminal domain-containing protein n=1 Tax=Bifiguratus adelaidae TaxID=1938954 RepID=A0A261Y8H1_9FUNG|nr:hypothetical protein BZG36_00250 [Bifiguratus adelaidae]
MFYSEAILSKKGPLAKVWLAAHWERKLTKAQFIHTNIETSIGAIMGGDQPPMALRLSGQLLLGVVRIYSRKARYLLDDCNDALIRIKVAFHKGAVDMPADHTTANFNAITLGDAITEFDLLLPDPMLPASNSQVPDIEYPRDGRNLFDLGGERGFLGFGEEKFFYPNEIEVGRDAARERSLSADGILGLRGDMSGDGSSVGGKERQSPAIPDPFDFGPDLFENDPLMGDDGDQLDLGNFDMNPIDIIDQHDRMGPFGDEGHNSLAFDIPDPSMLDLTEQVQQTTISSPRKRKLIVDKIAEIPDDEWQQQQEDRSDILTSTTFLPASKRMMALQSMLSKGPQHWLQLKAPPGMAPELQHLFKRNLKRAFMEDLAEDEAIYLKKARNNDFADAQDFDMPLPELLYMDDDGHQPPVDMAPPNFEEDEVLIEAITTTTRESTPEERATDLIELTTDLKTFIEANAPEDKEVTFASYSTKCNRRQAAKSFFDTLVLATRHNVKVRQEQPFGDIFIRL